MMRFTNPELQKEFQEAFGVSTETLTIRQLWWLVKFGKHVRGRCRSNAALINYLNASFPHARFGQITHTDTVTGRMYPKTVISLKGEVFEATEEDTDNG